MKSFLMFCLFACTSLFGFDIQRIVVIEQVPEKLAYRILLTDGTLWECYYKSLYEKNVVQECWETGQRVWVSHHSSDSENVFHLWSVNDRVAGSFVDMKATLELNSATSLPVIVGQMPNGNILLSDGSAWEEECWLACSMKDWSVGQRIIVVVYYGHKYNLINIDQSSGFFTDPIAVDAKLIN